ncbi:MULTISPECIES: DivIVA domain-containing protein [Clostridium]|uniref:Predicted cell-division initiation protein (DivIVA) n=2 Tax=Clostridium TaxID=1485 RepID=D8GQL4_CLOLD|nr:MULTISPECIES: DivIVA domain-containing protein [Clostridium]ADK14137.1 predicted cell-division initiation protein (divIVA) [Clostridium ljungdahlii DSM 13528]OAA86186.1 Septum site-determining protein DivIVA [Clostridium ljungdahlii DSM 13528]OAA89249.1 Septum site-determining protein DivIVA [Clostridium coskatii]OBR97357.1 septum site-determining protein DivIVA [Clostridium coskatii]
MFITAAEITNKEFKKGLRGYNIDEVDEFLDKIAEDYESIYKENSLLKEKMQSLDEKISHYTKMENTIKDTLLLAQNASEQAKENAKKESQFVVKNANDAAQKIIDKAHSDVIQITDEFENVKQEFSKFRTKFRNFMKTQMEMFDDMEKDFVKNYNIGYESNENEVEDSTVKEKEIEVVEPEKEDVSLAEKRSKEFDEDNKEDSNHTEKEIFEDKDELEEIKNFFIKG